MNANLYARIRAAMPNPAKTFIETGTGRRLDYGEVDAMSGRTANTLAALGVAPGDRVAVQVEKSPEALILYLACLRVGAVYLPLNTAYTVSEVDYFLGDAEPALVVCDPERRAAIANVAGERGVGHVETLGADGGGTLAEKATAAKRRHGDVERAGDDLAAILYTSGTTGRSKGAMLSHDNLASNAAVLVDAWRFSADDVLLHALPIYHTHGLFVASNVMLLAAGSMLFLPKFDTEEVIGLLPRATAMMGVPTFYMRLLAHPGFSRKLVAHMRLFISGSAPLLAETHAEFKRRTGHAILERYGMTETGMNTSNPYDGERIAGTVGFALPGTEIRVADAVTGAVRGRGEIGVLEVRGPNVFSGYWRMPQKTAEEFRDDGFFVTGDIGLIDEKGYAHIVGRAKDLIISGGFNVYPKEVEMLIDALPGVAESAVIGAPHPDLGEGVAAVVVRYPDTEISETDILAGLKDRIAKFKQPKRVFLLDSLPRNAMGKVQKNVLRERYADIFCAKTGHL